MRSHTAWRLHVMAIILSTACLIEGTIKCYCNLPECQTTGHICSSYSEFCFSKLYIKSETDQNDTSADVHGCVELLPENSPDSVCDGSGDAVQRTPGGSPLLYCCSDSMCNYKQNQDVSVDIVEDSTKYGIFHPQEKERATSTEFPSVITPSVSPPTTRKEDVIFKAAVVAVPIAGSLILIILIVMAVKMLREDRRNSNRSSGGFIKTQGFIQQHFNKKNQKHTTSSADKLLKPQNPAHMAVNIDDESLHPLRKPHKLLKAEKPASVHSSLSVV